MTPDNYAEDTEISFAIAYEFNEKMLKLNCGASYNEAADEFESHLYDWGFTNKQGSVVYGDNTVTMVSSVVVMVEASKKFKWLDSSLEYARVLQLINSDNLKPALKSNA